MHGYKNNANNKYSSKQKKQKDEDEETEVYQSIKKTLPAHTVSGSDDKSESDYEYEEQPPSQVKS